MAGDAFGIETLKVINDLHRRGITKYALLMQHVERPIDTAENDLSWNLQRRVSKQLMNLGKPCRPMRSFDFTQAPSIVV